MSELGAPSESATLAATRFLVVDRLEGDLAVLIDDTGAASDVPASAFAMRLREGLVLRVADGPDGVPDWFGAVVDGVERDRRISDLAVRAVRLQATDPGGDLAL